MKSGDVLNRKESDLGSSLICSVPRLVIVPPSKNSLGCLSGSQGDWQCIKSLGPSREGSYILCKLHICLTFIDDAIPIC